MAEYLDNGEAIKEGRRDVSIRTDTAYTRGTVERFDEETVLLHITYPPENAGSKVEIKRKTLQENASFEYRGVNDKITTEWKPSGPLREIAKWGQGTPVSLDTLIANTENRDQSADLPLNSFTLPNGVPNTTEHARRANDAYTKELAPYYHHDEPLQYAITNPKDGKSSAPLKMDTGWKVHLNVAPENAKAVSEYLKLHHYNHKFLSGGEPDDGKVFTVYFGPKSVMDQWVGMLATDLKDKLASPGAYNEAEVACGIVGRFTVDDNEARGGGEFRQYGAYGLSFLKDAKVPWKATRDERITDAKKTYARLKELYGSYFSD